MCDLVAENDSEGGFVLGDREQSFVNNYLAAGHTEGVDGVVLDEVKLPVEVLEFVGKAIVAEIGFDSCGETLSDTLDEGGAGGVGGHLGAGHVVLVL